MAGTKRRAALLLLTCTLAFCCQVGAGNDKEKVGADEQQGSKAKSFAPRKQRAARDYHDVDPTFAVSFLEASMTGGDAQIDVERKLATDVHGRLENLLRGTKTEECRAEILKVYQDYIGAQALERSIPFEGEKFFTQCVDANDRPPVPETGLLDPQKVNLAYIILAHEEPDQVVRVVNALDDKPGREETRTWFILHVDAKAEEVQQKLIFAFKDRPNVIIMEQGRQDVSWGGFNVVQATLYAIKLALEKEIPFHWLWILSGTTYPIASNDDIRAKLASYHPESIFMESRPSAHKPASTAWHYFVECDSALHRIGRNVTPRNMDMYVGSQWLAMPPVAAKWLMQDQSLVPQYRLYAEHIVVADENFLPTMFRNSPFCAYHVSSNFVHVQFDRYEHTLDREDRRSDKCLMPNPDHCGRSPATMTVDYLSVLEHSNMLFARKFDPKDTEIFKVLDEVRGGQHPWRQGKTFDYIAILAGNGEGNEPAMCLTLGAPPATKGQTTVAKMEACNFSDRRQIFKLGPCSFDGDLELPEGGKGYMKSTRGTVTNRGASCSIKSAEGFCLDLLGEAKGPGAPAISYKCHNRWNQFFNFGNGELAGHLESTVPGHLVMAKELNTGTLCLEVMSSEGEGDPAVVKTAQCSPGSAAQKFSMIQLYPRQPAAQVADQTKVAQDKQCSADNGSCTAK